MENKTSSGGRLVWLVIGIGVVGLIGSIVASSISAARQQSIETPAVAPAAHSAGTSSSVALAASSSAIPLSQAIENYSDNSNYNFNDGSGSTVDVTGVVKTLVAVDPQNSVLSPFGNTAIITDGAYSAAVHSISDSDFQNLYVGEKVEVKGGYMQSPSNNVAQIIKVGSVTLSGQ